MIILIPTNVFDFLIAQQHETKRIIGKTISYHQRFEKYIK